MEHAVPRLDEKMKRAAKGRERKNTSRQMPIARLPARNQVLKGKANLLLAMI